MAAYEYPNLPVELQESLRRYADERIPTGGFLAAVLANDFMRAVKNAHRLLTAESLRDAADYVSMELPSPCHGSYEAVRAWLAGGA